MEVKTIYKSHLLENVHSQTTRKIGHIGWKGGYLVPCLVLKLTVGARNIKELFWLKTKSIFQCKKKLLLFTTLNAFIKIQKVNLFSALIYWRTQWFSHLPKSLQFKLGEAVCLHDSLVYCLDWSRGLCLIHSFTPRIRHSAC